MLVHGEGQRQGTAENTNFYSFNMKVSCSGEVYSTLYLLAVKQSSEIL